MSMYTGAEKGRGYAVQTVARLQHEGDPAHVEELAEVTSPDGRTVAYFVDGDMAEKVCSLMNARRSGDPTEERRR